MQNIDQVIIANHDQNKNDGIANMLRESGFDGIIKRAVNAGQALLYLDHLALVGKLYESKVLVLLNLNTPIITGLEFLSSFNDNKKIRKENVILIVLSDNLKSENVEKSKLKGVKDFLPFSFKMIELEEITERYNKPHTTSTFTSSNLQNNSNSKPNNNSNGKINIKQKKGTGNRKNLAHI